MDSEDSFMSFREIVNMSVDFLYLFSRVTYVLPQDLLHLKKKLCLFGLFLSLKSFSRFWGKDFKIVIELFTVF